MDAALLGLVGTALRVAKQELGKRAGKPSQIGLVHEIQIVVRCIRKEERPQLRRPR